MIHVLAQEAANSSYLLWGFVLLAAMIVLVVLELFVPSGGVIGALAGVAAIGSITAFFAYDTVGGFVALSSYLVLTPILLWAVFKYWIYSPMARGMILGGADIAAEGDADSASAAERRRRERLSQLQELIGAEGETVTPLRPVGTVKIAGRRIDALAESGAIDARTPVVVVEVYDNQIKVRPKDA